MSTDLDKVPSALAVSGTFDNLRTLLSGTPANTFKTNIFVFAGNAGFSYFYNDFDYTNLTGGVTIRSGKNIYSNPWESGSIGSSTLINPYSQPQYLEVSAHELGHAVDRNLGLTSTSANYNTWFQHDVTTFDYTDLTGAHGGPTPRSPCAPTMLPDGTTTTDLGEPVPFAGVIDTNTGLSVCNADGTLNDNTYPYHSQGLNWPPGTRPSQVMQLLSPAIWVATAQRPAWVELHAQIFAYIAVGNQGARPFDDAVFGQTDATSGKSYFPCIKSWASTEQNTGTNPTAASCSLNP